jgi:hypothetical protein
MLPISFSNFSFSYPSTTMKWNRERAPRKYAAEQTSTKDKSIDRSTYGKKISRLKTPWYVMWVHCMRAEQAFDESNAIHRSTTLVDQSFIVDPSASKLHAKGNVRAVLQQSTKLLAS